MDDNGIWRTVGGKRIFIRDGEDLRTAMERSGKFKLSEEQQEKQQLERYKKEIDYIKEQTGFDDKEALKTYGAITHYTTSAYEDIRNGKAGTEKERETIEKYIEKSPKYKGEIYRGIHFKDDTFVNKLEEGKVINMNGISSWSSDKKVAENFSNGEIHRVVFSMNNKSGADISKISAIEDEKEVIQSSKNYYNITKVDKQKGEGDTYLWKVTLEEL